MTAERLDLISAARYEIGEQNPFWSQPVLRAMEARRPDAPFDWVEQSLRLWLPASGSPHSHELLDDLELLPARVREDTGGSLLLENALEIWYRPGRDQAKTAVSKLYGARACRQRGLLRQALFELSAPPNLMLWPDREEPALPTVVDLLLGLVTEIMADPDILKR